MIEIKNLSKTYNTADGTVEALKDVSITIPDGDIFGIIGMSGAGKSTLVRCWNDLLKALLSSMEQICPSLMQLHCVKPEEKLR